MNFSGFQKFDSRDYAQLARNLHEGHGFSTNIIFPFSLKFSPDFQSHPDLWRPPVLPLFISLGYEAFGVHSEINILVSGLFYLLTILTVYRLIEELLESPKYAFIGGLLLATSPVFLLYSLRGTTETLVAFLITLSTLLVVKRTRPLLVGMILGIAYLTKYNCLFFLPGFAVIAIKLNDRNLSILLEIFIGFVVASSFWWGRNTILVGNPFYQHQVYELAMFNSVYPGYSLYHFLNPPDPFIFALENPIVILEKFYRGITILFAAVPQHFFNILFPSLALLGIHQLVDTDNPPGALLPVVIGYGTMGLVQWIILSLVHPVARLFVPLFPVVFLLAIWIFNEDLNSGDESPLKIFSCYLLAFLIGFNVLSLGRLSLRADVSSREVNSLRSIIPQGEVVVTNLPSMVAWNLNRTALVAPKFRILRNKFSESNYVLLSSSPDMKTDVQQSWLDHYRSKTKFKKNYRLMETYSSGSRLYKRK